MGRCADTRFGIASYSGRGRGGGSRIQYSSIAGFQMSINTKTTVRNSVPRSQPSTTKYEWSLIVAHLLDGSLGLDMEEDDKVEKEDLEEIEEDFYSDSVSSSLQSIPHSLMMVDAQRNLSFWDGNLEPKSLVHLDVNPITNLLYLKRYCMYAALSQMTLIKVYSCTNRSFSPLSSSSRAAFELHTLCRLFTMSRVGMK